MNPYHTSERAIFYNGDCRLVMAEMEDNSVDSIVCDPPYEIGFMGRGWDSTGIAYEVRMWQEALRVLKPGGYLLAFGGSRTYHRLACSIEDAGFEIRDQIMWVYGSGFPKSMDVSKSIDKAAGAKREVIGYEDRRGAFDGVERNSDGHSNEYGTITNKGVVAITAAATDQAKRWDGWGTALKPAHEPIVVARKPLIGTVAANVLQHGTGALNIDGCRIETSDSLGGGDQSPATKIKVEGWNRPWMQDENAKAAHAERVNKSVAKAEELGRWPSNLIHDGSDEVLALFPSTSPSPLSSSREEYAPNNKNNVFGEGMGGGWHPGFGDEGSAARFFYCAKTSGDDRHEGVDNPGSQFKHGNTLRKIEKTETKGNNHPTVKPTSLMRYLCRLVTPPRGLILDPFMGSGSTYKAAYQEGFNFVGIELNEPYCEIAINRISQNVLNFLP